MFSNIFFADSNINEMQSINRFIRVYTSWGTNVLHKTVVLLNNHNINRFINCLKKTLIDNLRPFKKEQIKISGNRLHQILQIYLL